jgi:RES domain-containing protein
MRVVRLAKRQHATLDGKGAAITGGRWNSPLRAVAYAASCGALTVVEYLAHMETLPANLILMLIEIPDTLEVERVYTSPVDLAASRQIGDAWLNGKSTAVLEVPSVLVPRQKNFLINPDHPLFGAIKVIEKTPFAFDSRLLSSIPPA